MAITTTLKTGYLLRTIAITVVSLVLGLWGIYDYRYAIPNKAIAYERWLVVDATKTALETRAGEVDLKEKIKRALALTQEQLTQILQQHATALAITLPGPDTPEGQNWFQMMFALTWNEGVEVPEEIKALPDYAEAAKMAAAVQDSGDYDWLRNVALFQLAVAQVAMRPLREGEYLKGLALQAHELTAEIINDLGVIEPPGKWDRLTQWMFIACLPFVPWFLWSLSKTKKQVYRLDDEGALHTPNEVWTSDEIEDIDMSRWMAKSVAFVVHTDGRRAKLDDYLFKNTHLIVGAIASEKYPEQWDDEAKIPKKDEPEAEAELEEPVREESSES